MIRLLATQYRLFELYMFSTLLRKVVTNEEEKGLDHFEAIRKLICLRLSDTRIQGHSGVVVEWRGSKRGGGRLRLTTHNGK